MKQRWLPSIPQSMMVFAFWMLMAEHFDAANVIMALLLAWVMPVIAARLEREFARVGDLRYLPPLVLRLLGDIVLANLTVARQVLGPNRRLRSDFVWVPLDLTNIHGIAMLTSLITITPGTLSADLSQDRRFLLIHCLDVDDHDAFIHYIKQRYEAPLRKLFP